MPSGVYIRTEECKRVLRMGCRKGYNHPRWKGGISKNSAEYRKQYRHRLGISKTYQYGLSKTKAWRQAWKALRGCKNGTIIQNIQIIQKVYEDNIKKYGTLTCYLCEKSIPFGKDSIEHKIPICRGGTNDYENLAIAHLVCNRRKHNLTEEEFRNKKGE